MPIGNVRWVYYGFVHQEAAVPTDVFNSASRDTVTNIPGNKTAISI